MYAKLISLVALLAGLVFAGSALAGRPGPGEPSDWPPPWTKPSYHGYTEPARPPLPPPAVIAAAPAKFTLAESVVSGYMPTARAAEAPAKIHVLLPAGATLTFDGAPTQSTSRVRDFVTPPLEAGKDFHYDLAARLVRNGESVTIERRITVRAGEDTVTDLSLSGASPSGNEAFYYSPDTAPTAPLVESRRPIRIVPDAPSGPAGVGGARNNWKPDSSDPFYPWD